MSGTYDNRRDNFNIIVGKYKDYIALYKFFNNGSTQGLTTFDDFYWRFIYTEKYDDPSRITQVGY